MNRRILLKSLAMVAVFPLIPACLRENVIGVAPNPVTPLNKSHEAWRGLLSPKAYNSNYR